jgi:WD40 repeat protein/serine/threonine protein kinase
MATELQRTCPSCGNRLPGAIEFCPVCMLRNVLGGGLESGESSASQDMVNPMPAQVVQRFDQYELVKAADGTPVELGRGAMGVTYKAFDVDLRCPVALKVINERYLDDETARLRFLREARAAASVRHPNVASVFHLGRIGQNYFYTMEFVEGETLQNLIKRSGQLEVGLALEIATQVAAGLVAVHKQKLVHRDIKSGNVMVSVEGGATVTAKIIDLGLAKPAPDAPASVTISNSGAFAGTPEFASPEQFAGGSVDIRSDLYSLGVVLWEMLAGQTPFKGTLADVMNQHQRARLPVEQLEDVPQPVVVLLEVLLRKDPARRFQSPTEFLKVMPMVTDAIEAGRTLMKGIRVCVCCAGDVQKEQILADRLMRSIAGEFNLPVECSLTSFQRLTEKSAELSAGPETVCALLICPYFLDNQRILPDAHYQGKRPNLTEFDLVICILWSRLGTLPTPSLGIPEGNTAISATEHITGCALDHAKKNGGIPALCVYRNCSKPTPPLEPKEEREAFARNWDALEGFFAHWEQHTENNVAAKLNTYRNLEEFEEVFREHFRNFLTSEMGQEAQWNATKVRRWKSNPFRGLSFFDFKHAPIFHGRTKAIGEVLEALEAQAKAQRPFVLIVGASGSGKSSLARAGVLPLLAHPGIMEGIGLWRRSITRPGAGGSDGDCCDALAAALLEPSALPELEDPESPNAIRGLATELREHPDTIALRVRDAIDHAAREWKIQQSHHLKEKERRLQASGRSDDANLARRQRECLVLPKARVAVVVDQLEELFTSGFSPEVRQKYVSAIAALVRSGRVFVLATLRSDFYSSYQEFPELTELTKPSGKFDLRAPTPYEIGNMIRLPAEAAGLRFEQEHVGGQRLDEALRDAASAKPESLPLLEHVLSLLYDKQHARSDDLIRWSDYREVGELEGALAKHAEAVFSTLRPEEQRAFPLVMRRLVTLGQGEEEVPNRRTAPYHDFIATEGIGEKTGAKGFVDLFVEKRLLVADADPQREMTVSVAHEALLREWRRVREWLAENREFLRMRDRLDSSLKLWLSRGKQKDDLLGPGLPLAEGEKLIKDFGSSLSLGQSEYISASVAERRRRRQAEERIRYAVMAAISVLAIIAGFQWLQAELQRQSAEKNAESARRNEARSKDLLRESSKVDFMTATQQKDPAAKLAYLARAVRNDPSNQVASITLEQLITRQGSFPKVPVSSFGHAASLISASYSPDGRLIVTASADRTARVWETTTGKPVGKPLRHDAPVNSAVFSPDGKWIVTASDDGSARVWDWTIGKSMGEPMRHDGRVNSAVFSPDGKWVVTASDDGTARLWDGVTGKPVEQPLRHDGFVFSAGFSPDGKWVVTSSSDQTTRIWEAATGKPVGQPLQHAKDVWYADFSPDAKLVVTASGDGTARLWETATGKPVGQPLRHDASVERATFSPDGTRIVTASQDHTARVWDVATSRPVAEPLRHDNSVNSAAFSPDGKWVVTASQDHTVRVWETATGTAVGEPLQHDTSVRSATFSPDGVWVLTAGDDHTARVWPAPPGSAASETLRHDGGATSVAVSPDGKWIVTASADHTARVWEIATGKAVGPPLRHDRSVTRAAFSPGGESVLTASSDGSAQLWRVATGKAVGEPMRHRGGVSSATFSPDGKFLVTASWDATARVWDAATGQAVGPPLQHDGAINSAAFSPDGKLVVTASADHRAQVWQALTSQPVGQPLKHDGYVWDATFSPDGKLVATASGDGTARIWETQTGKAVALPLHHKDVVMSVAFNPDGRWIVTASADGTTQVWEVATGKAVSEPLRHDGVVNSALFSPDGKWVVTASADHSARTWEAATGKSVGEPMQHNGEVLHATFGPDGKWVVTASSDYTARVWEAPLEEPLSEQLINVVKSLPALIGHLDFDANGFLKPVPGPRVSECRNQISMALKQPEIRDSLLATRIEWFLADPRTRSINPTSKSAVPNFMLSTITWCRNASKHARDPIMLAKKKALEEAYQLDPAFPLIHLALAGVEADPGRAAFLRDFDLKRLPDSCSYTADLDPAEITLEAAEMCAEQKDWPRALVALNEYQKLGKPNSRSAALRVEAEKSLSPAVN